VIRQLDTLLAPGRLTVDLKARGAEMMVRIERGLGSALVLADGRSAPPRLAAAMRSAVFPGGARVRPRLCIAVAQACGEDLPEVTDAAASALELLHCASLVHDDLPCFDDADTRRGRPSVHRAYGERLAVLAGDALIVLAFQTLSLGAARAPQRLAPLLSMVARSVGSPDGICAGQAWECEPRVALSDYHRAKTGALFAAATMAGAESAGAPAAPWRALGERLGEAYQVADDICDAAGDESETGKPTGRDSALARPSAVAEAGLAGAIARFRVLVDAVLGSVPPCPGEDELRSLVYAEAQRLIPKKLARLAA
jgi:geranylgeranyl diphosphate synthase type II